MPPHPSRRPTARLGCLAVLLLCLVRPARSLDPLRPFKSRHTSYLDPERYTSLDLTHVEFDSTDPLAQLLGLVTLSPIFLLCAYVTLVLHRRELLFLNAFIGQITCEWFNGQLKGVFKQERPTDRFGQGYGMPSSHSQFVGYFAAFFLSHFIAFWPGRTRWVRSRSSGGSKVNGGQKLVQTDKVTPIYLIRTMEHVAACGAIVVVTMLTAYSRYHLMYHSSAQIVVGLTIGTAYGLVYYHVTERLSRRSLFAPVNSRAKGKAPRRTPIRQMILDHPIAVALRVRDSYSVFSDGGIESEYGAWREGWLARRAQGHDGDDVETRRERMYRALALADKCEPTDTAFCVGCVICPSPGALDRDDTKETLRALLASTARDELGTTSTDERLGLLVTGFSRELPGNTHAEESALMKLLALEQKQKGEGLLAPSPRIVKVELDLYTTMEPCSERLSKKAACVQNILDFNAARHRLLLSGGAKRRGGARRRKVLSGEEEEEGVIVELHISRVLQGVKEPEDFVQCQGTRMLRQEGGIEVITVTDGEEVGGAKKGRIEFEALRLAKKGHADQPKKRGDEGIWAGYRD